MAITEVELIKMAEEGNVQAQYTLGKHYKNGKKLKKNPIEAFKWLNRAAKKDHAKALNLLGECFRKGFGTRIDHKEAFQLYTKAAKLGCVAACFNLGQCYEYGLGVEINTAKAITYYFTSEKMDSAYTQTLCKLGECYQRGFGVEEDLDKAAKYFQKAAEKGFARAQAQLGECYCRGWGVEIDVLLAGKWLEKAADKGMRNATAARNLLQQNGVYHKASLALIYKSKDPNTRIATLKTLLARHADVDDSLYARICKELLVRFDEIDKRREMEALISPTGWPKRTTLFILPDELMGRDPPMGKEGEKAEDTSTVSTSGFGSS